MITGHWQGDWLLKIRVCDKVDRQSFALPLSLSLPPFHCTSFLLSTSLLSPSLSPSFPLHLLLQPPVTCLSLPRKTDHSCWAGAPKCVNQYPVHTITTSDWAPAGRSVQKWTTALIHGMLLYDKAGPNGFEMSHRLRADMWKWPISSMEDHYSFGLKRLKKQNLSIKSNKLKHSSCTLIFVLIQSSWTLQGHMPQG